MNTSRNKQQQNRSQGSPNKQPLTFVSEGVTNIEDENEKAKLEQEKFERESKIRSRKTLRDQLRSSAISKQKEFNGLVKQRESFNRLNEEEIEFFKSIEDAKLAEESKMNEYLSSKLNTFEKKKRLLELKSKKKPSASVHDSDKSPKLTTPSPRIVKIKSKKKKLGLKVNLKP
ncbi:hypothetical protein NCAS_0E00650 [Naumovozyma castellii]|uniref:FAM192A/Fyv6 N-terminal domain-containing protein n=1 Tax=Naumovozyma castellii TaxID=27288 RepID=G0VF70_NAUCA|nr:hypothetical protein NCAS_0E00650 [Naumovozyma castellii CBS 4309]CCC70135.1 hypothetical protein NCAS_0E00650 [Naumovozyma castellii CBS 4309]